FLGERKPCPVATTDEPITERPGTVIGPYKLLEQIGEGGFGVVFMAEQTQPVRRRVALKVLKPGMDTRQIVARFEAERQALALMDHPNIACVFDGNETATGRPFFVMELVRGIPITEFCDQNHLTVRQRLELFITVCQAIQHAHLKGIIHRDVKPTHVMVTRHDATPLAKVIAFGIAKATGHKLSEKTLVTNSAQLIGTPLYMSPEQAQMCGLDIDTRTDIYALGVLLYELLTGTTPFDRERLKTVSFDEIRRILREEEPAKPSTRISTLGQAATTVSANRGTELRKLSTLVRGELDWIVMKALEKDRNRRYATANGLAADVQRYLNDEPVQACPPSAAYWLRKFALRNKRLLATAALLGGMLLTHRVAGARGAVGPGRSTARRQAPGGTPDHCEPEIVPGVGQPLSPGTAPPAGVDGTTPGPGQPGPVDGQPGRSGLLAPAHSRSGAGGATTDPQLLGPVRRPAGAGLLVGHRRRPGGCRSPLARTDRPGRTRPTQLAVAIRKGTVRPTLPVGQPVTPGFAY